MSPEVQSWGMIILLIAVFYFFMIRPQQKRSKETKKFRDSLGKGSKVMTAGGIHGTISEINPQNGTVLLEVANGVRIRVEISMIYPSADEAKADAANPVNAEQK
ncbi:MAG: preprotein translocase subunit YajC [Muribaculaceae bacterium]|nr:preprotein translocase subunit YajC [Muribaculaceae bacterium]MDE6166799.1 preprotein translocase subunit YajC [Muribaculaceae bacterium]MDE6367405.1 preprotein translocase subunit YajC [Muribaculaceae bacterium]